MNVISKIKILSIIALVLSMLLMCGCDVYYEIIDFKKNLTSRVDDAYYFDKIEEMLEQNETVLVKEIFDFNFSKAYLFHDPYISGEAFANEYNLDIRISNARQTSVDTLGRIVFVDENGDYVRTFIYDVDDLYPEKLGLVIYPDTKISRCADYESSSSLTLRFDSEEYYYKSRPSEQYTEVLLDYWNWDKTLKAYNIFYFGYSGFSKAKILGDEEKIIFYDKDGVVMYEYTYDASKICFEELGITFFPDSTIKKCNSNELKIPKFNFISP